MYVYIYIYMLRSLKEYYYQIIQAPSEPQFLVGCFHSGVGTAGTAGVSGASGESFGVLGGFLLRVPLKGCRRVPLRDL